MSFSACAVKKRGDRGQALQQGARIARALGNRAEQESGSVWLAGLVMGYSSPYLVRVRYDESPLARKGVAQVGNHLYGRVSLARARWADDDRQAGVHRRT